MDLMQKIINLFFGNNPIRHSNITSIATRYGIYRVKAYHDVEQEYLAIMSRNFFDLESPIVYIHSEFHHCSDVACHCTHQLDVALKMISKEGGVVIYHSTEGSSIDGLLSEINARKIQTETATSSQSNARLGLKAFERKHHTLGFILNDLNLSAMKLICADPNVPDIAQQMNIKITQSVPTISYVGVGLIWTPNRFTLGQ